MAPRIMKTCPECGNRFPQAHHRQLFCIPAHGRAYNNRIISQGQSVMGLAKAWRASRPGGGQKDTEARSAMKAANKELFILLCREIDESNAQDRKAGRMNAAALYMSRRAGGYLD